MVLTLGYAVVHMQKIKAGGVKGIQIHNKREKESRTNPDIDKSKSHENYDFIANENYQRAIKDTIKNFATETTTVRKDAVVCCSFIITSDELTMKAMDSTTQEEFFKESLEFFCDRYGIENIPYATVHMDERTPHMHIGVVPIKDDRLSAKNLFDRQELTSIQTDFAEQVGKRFGLERGKEGSERTHLSEQQFKLEMAKQQTEMLERKGQEIAIEAHKRLSLLQKVQAEAELLEKEKKALQEQINALRKDLELSKDIKGDLDKIDALEGKLGLLSKDKVTISTEDFKLLKDMGKNYRSLEREIDFLKRQNKNLSDDLGKLQTKTLDSYQKDIAKEKTFKAMEKEIDTVRQFLQGTNQLEDYRQFKAEQKQPQKEQPKLQKKMDLDMEM